MHRRFDHNRTFMHFEQTLLNRWDFAPQVLSGAVANPGTGRRKRQNRTAPKGPFLHYTVLCLRSGFGRYSLTDNNAPVEVEGPVSLLFQPGVLLGTELAPLSEFAWLDFGLLRQKNRTGESRVLRYPKGASPQPSAREALGQDLPITLPSDLFDATWLLCNQGAGEFWKDDLGSFKANLRLGQWLVFLLSSARVKDPGHTKTEQRFQDYLHLAERHIHQQIHPEIWAQYIGISRRQLDQLCQQQTGMSAKECLDGLKLQRAQEHLLARTYSMDNLARASGFLSNSSFTRWFKSKTGYSPSRWRERMNCVQ